MTAPSPSLSSVLLAANGLALSRGGRRVLTGVSLALSAGESVLLRGANGAGKTTLLRALAGLLPVDSGAIEPGDPEKRRALTVYGGHADAAKAAMSVTENARFWAKLYGAPAARAAEALAALDILPLAARRAGDLSAGQRRRLAMARIVIAGRPVWLLDEPAASMDAASAEKLLAVIEDHCARGGAALIATHDRLALAGARTLTVEPAEAAA